MIYLYVYLALFVFIWVIHKHKYKNHSPTWDNVLSRFGWAVISPIAIILFAAIFITDCCSWIKEKWINFNIKSEPPKWL